MCESTTLNIVKITFKYGHSPGPQCSITVGCRIHHQYCCLLHTVDHSPGQVAWPALPVVAQQVPVAEMNSSQLVTHRPPPPHHHRPGVENAMHIVTVLITSSPQYSRSCHSRHIQSLILMNVRMALEEFTALTLQWNGYGDHCY